MHENIHYYYRKYKRLTFNDEDYMNVYLINVFPGLLECSLNYRASFPLKIFGDLSF